MGRKSVILQSEFPYHITARCINKEWFGVPVEEVWAICEQELFKTCEKNELRVHSFVLMTNHFHLIASTPRANISECMHRFINRTSLRIGKTSGRINETFADRHYKCVLQSANYFLNAYKYVYRNPVTAGICDGVESYPFSTLQKLLSKSPCGIPLVEDTTYEFDPAGTLKWLNETPPPEKLAAFRYGLKRAEFKSKKGKDRRPIFGPEDRL